MDLHLGARSKRKPCWWCFSKRMILVVRAAFREEKELLGEIYHRLDRVEKLLPREKAVLTLGKRKSTLGKEVREGKSPTACEIRSSEGGEAAAKGGPRSRSMLPERTQLSQREGSDR